MEEPNQTKKKPVTADTWFRLLLILLILLPLALFFLTPGGGLLAGGIWFWIGLLVSFWLIWKILGRPTRGQEESKPETTLLPAEQQPDVVRQVMNVKIAMDQAGVKMFRGGLRESATTAYEKLKDAFSGKAVPLIQEDEQMGATVLLIPRSEEETRTETRVRPWLHWLLFGLTLITTTWAGAAHHGVDLLRQPSRFAVGLPYSLGLLAILGIHELGHYFTARYHGMRVTPPYFIPIPFSLGTFGAFIQMRSPAENRRMMFDVAVAGPLAGLVVAIPALLVGLHSSTIVALNAPGSSSPLSGVSVGSSLLFALLSKVALGDALQFGHVLRLSPLAFAGWLGFLVTALNLLPIGQLDGGHMARAMFGGRVGSTISSVSLWSLFLLAIFVWPGLLMWAIIVFFIAGRGASPLNDVTGLTPWRRRIGYLTFLILGLILLPLPHTLWHAAGIHCPYA